MVRSNLMYVSFSDYIVRSSSPSSRCSVPIRYNRFGFSLSLFTSSVLTDSPPLVPPLPRRVQFLPHSVSFALPMPLMPIFSSLLTVLVLGTDCFHLYKPPLSCRIYLCRVSHVSPLDVGVISGRFRFSRRHAQSYIRKDWYRSLLASPSFGLIPPPRSAPAPLALGSNLSRSLAIPQFPPSHFFSFALSHQAASSSSIISPGPLRNPFRRSNSH